MILWCPGCDAGFVLVLWLGFCFCMAGSVFGVGCVFVFESLFRAFHEMVFCGEFDPGSGRTLAACLTHASRTMKLVLALVD